MNRIIFPLVAFAFVQRVNGQASSEACMNAFTALQTNTACTIAYAIGTDASTLCMGTCRDLFNDIINNCGATGDAYSKLLGTLCTGGNTGGSCEAAVNSVSDACGDSLGDGDNSVCSGTCAAQFNAVVAACGSTNEDLIAVRERFNQLCGSGSMLKASGVITLLIVAISALIF